jgi:hypothetical protein
LGLDEADLLDVIRAALFIFSNVLMAPPKKEPEFCRDGVCGSWFSLEVLDLAEAVDDGDGLETGFPACAGSGVWPGGGPPKELMSRSFTIVLIDSWI